MALATTTLSSACAATDNSIVVASATSMAAGRIVLVDQEFMKVNAGYVSGTTVGVLRGQNGSSVVAHVTTTNVTHGASGDFSNPPAGIAASVNLPASRAFKLYSQTATGTITLPITGENILLVLNGTSVIAVTVPVPTKDMDGTMMFISGNGVAAHTVTFTGGLSGAGTSYDVITVNASAPITLGPFVAVNGLWQCAVAVPMAGTVTNITGTVA